MTEMNWNKSYFQSCYYTWALSVIIYLAATNICEKFKNKENWRNFLGHK